MTAEVTRRPDALERLGPGPLRLPIDEVLDFFARPRPIRSEEAEAQQAQRLA